MESWTQLVRNKMPKQDWSCVNFKVKYKKFSECFTKEMRKKGEYISVALARSKERINSGKDMAIRERGMSCNC